jgi:peptidyl-prolyl cis-trans isomerase C
MQAPKKNKNWITLLLAIIAILGLTVPSSATEKETTKSEVAVVNGAVITQEDLDRELDNVRRQFARRGRNIDESQLPNLRQRVIDSLIDRELLYQDSKKQGIKIESSVVDQQYEKIKNRFSDEERFEELMDRMNFSEAEAKKDLEKRLAVKELIDTKFVAKLDISDEESKAFYEKNRESFTRPEEVRASHILIKVDPKADKAGKEEARKKIDEVQQKLKDGGDFSDLAKKYSEGPTATKEGDLGFFPRGKMVKPFEEAAFSLRVGEVSDVVETSFGYHLIKITDKKPQGIDSYENQKENINRFLRQLRLQELLGGYTAELREKANIEKPTTESSK